MPASGYAAAARLVDRPTLRAMALALRGDVERFDPPDDPDPGLVEVVDRPFGSVAGVVDRLSRLEGRLRERDDRRAVFLTIYVRMTRAVHGRIGTGAFEDPGWMRRYLVAFAGYYRRAFLAFERGNLGAVPDPWRIAFGTAVAGDGLIAQDAYLGVNAHINYDLALALRDVGIDPRRPRKYADHRAVNGILADLVDVQQEVLAEVYAPGIADVDAALGDLDEAFTLFSMVKGREGAWRIAVVLTDVGLPPVASYARWVLRAASTGGALFILSPALDRSLLGALRRVERDRIDLGDVLDRVAGRADERV